MVTNTIDRNWLSDRIKVRNTLNPVEKYYIEATKQLLLTRNSEEYDIEATE